MIITKREAAESTIHIEEHFRASRERVFRAWTDPNSLKKWFMAEEKVLVKDVDLTLEVGGSYFIKVIYPGYDPTSITGEFIKVQINDSLEYTWHTPVLGDKSTKVEVRFSNLEIGSSIHLIHGEFTSPEEMQLHIDGWKGCLNQLHKHLRD